MATSTTIKILSDDPLPVLIAGMVVQFYDLNGLFLTEGMTDTAGQTTVLLPDGTYDLLFYKAGVSILPRQPQRIIVDAAAPTNIFDVMGHVRTLPESLDPMRCRISGYVVGQDSLPVKDLQFSFQYQQDVALIGEKLVAPQGLLRVEPDDSGYYQFDLIRGLKYAAYIRYVDSFPLLSITPAAFDVWVPDLPALSLLSLLFPVPVRTTFSEVSISIPLSGGPDSSVLATTVFSDGSERGVVMPPWSTLMYRLSNPTVVEAVMVSGKLILTPVRLGTTDITLYRIISKSVFWPDAPLYMADTITVTVT